MSIEVLELLHALPIMLGVIVGVLICILIAIIAK